MSERATTHPRPVVILGPTAGGKSELAVGLAERLGCQRGDHQSRDRQGASAFSLPTESSLADARGSDVSGGEVIGADSMQVYKHMNAGTAKPTPAQRRRAAHHLIDIVEPTERFTVADWLTRADALIEKLCGRGVVPIVVGGTNLYIKSLLEGMFEGPPVDDALREKLNALPTEQLRARLEATDPAAARRIHANDRKRTVRALEVFEQTGTRISDLQTQWEQEGRGPRAQGQGPRAQGQGPGAKGQGPGAKGQGPRAQGQGKEIQEDGALRRGYELSSLGPLPSALSPGPSSLGPSYRHGAILIGLHWPTDAINRRINLRVKAMFFPKDVEPALAAEVTPGGESLVDETRRLEAGGLLGPQARKALGYAQVLDFLQGRCTLDDAFEKTKILTRRFAKTQRTWLRRFAGVHWIEAAEKTSAQLLDEAMAAVAGSL